MGRTGVNKEEDKISDIKAEISKECEREKRNEFYAGVGRA